MISPRALAILAQVRDYDPHSDSPQAFRDMLADARRLPAEEAVIVLVQFLQTIHEKRHV